jgi:WD40 repeat protein
VSADPVARVEQPEPGVQLYGEATPLSVAYPLFSWSISPDGQLLVAGGRGNEFEFWALAENRRVHSLPPLESNSVWFPSRFSARGDVLAATYQTWEAQGETRAEAYDPFQATTTILFLNQDGSLRSEVEIDDAFYSQRASDLSFSPDQKSFLFAGRRQTTIIDVDSGRIIAEKPDFRNAVFIDNRTVVSTITNQAWNFETDDLIVLPVDLFPPNCRLQAASSNGQWAMVDVPGKQCQIVRLADGKRISLPGIYRGLSSSFSADGRYLATSGYASDQSRMLLLVYDIREEKVLGLAETRSPMLAICGNRPQVMIWYGAFRLIDLAAEPDLEGQLKQVYANPIQANNLKFGNRDQWLVGGSGQFSLDLAGKQFRTYDRFSNTLTTLHDQPGYVFVNHQAQGLIGFGHGQQYSLARLDLVDDKISKLYDVRPRPSLIQGIRSLLGDGKPVQPIMLESRGIFVSEDSRVLFDIRAETTVGLFVKSFDLTANQPRDEVRLEVPRDLVTNQTSLATMSGDRQKTAIAIGRDVWVLETKSGQILQQWQLPQPALQLVLDRTGKCLAVTHPGVRLREKATGRSVAVYDVDGQKQLFTEQTDPILALAFHPDKPQLMVATTGDVNRYQAYEQVTGQLLRSHQTGYNRPLSAAFSRDGNQLAWGLVDTRVELWDLRRF